MLFVCTGNSVRSPDHAAFQRTAADIDARVRHLLPVLTATDHEKDQP